MLLDFRRFGNSNLCQISESVAALRHCLFSFLLKPVVPPVRMYTYTLPRLRRTA